LLLKQYEILLSLSLFAAGHHFCRVNVVDLQRLYRPLGREYWWLCATCPTFRRSGPVAAGDRRRPQLASDEAAGPTEQVAGLYVQRCGITPENTEKPLAGLQQNAQLPEPLRVAHMIAGGVTTGENRHRA
jgi:endonuclease V-like protein UPF0215 family